MGSVLDRCGRLERHIAFEAGVQEAVVCWNAPKPYHADANYSNAFLERALSLHVKGCLAFHAHGGSHNRAR
jgi:hypothetical protein